MTDHSKYDVIVIGVGSMGSATCYYLAKQGIKVLGLEQFNIPNDKSSHTGQSRIIRKAYFEHPDYVPLLERAYDNWAELESASGMQVYYETGLLYCGMPDHPVIKGVRLSADMYDIVLEEISVGDAKAMYPHLDIPDEYEILFEAEAGFITPEKAIKAYADTAVHWGATIQANVKVESWRKVDSEFEVITSMGIFHAGKLIFTAGPWVAKLLPSLAKNINVTRQVLAWVNTKQNSFFELGTFPCWMIADDDKPGVFYGFPILPTNDFDGPAGFKLALHYPGEITDPDIIDRSTNKTDESLLIEFMQRHFPDEYVSTVDMKVCMYTNSPDENFIIDFLPGYDNDIVVATGFSGHGFKFASVIGEIMSDLIIRGKTEMPIEFLRMRRFD